MLFLVTFFIVLVTYISINYIKALSYWKNKGVKYLRPLPILGNTLPTILQTVSLSEWVMNMYNTFPKERYCGIYQFGRPILMVRDPELIKQIYIRHFDSFSAHAPLIDKKTDPFWGNNLIAAEGPRWKNLRQTLSPAFTSNKMKSMFTLMEEYIAHLVDYLKEQKKDIVELELNDIIKRVTADIIGTAAFGLEVNSLKDKNNEFICMGRELTNLKGLKKFKFLMYDVNPVITKFLNVKIVTDKVANFFHTMIKNTMEYRTKEKIRRPDLLHLLMEAKKGQLKAEEASDINDSFATSKEAKFEGFTKDFALTLTDVDLTAQALVFFVGGYDTTSTLISFSIYELVANPDIQERLRADIDEMFAKHNGKITYEGLFQMKYLDMVISETLRKWPPKPFIDRKVTKAFTITPEKIAEKPVSLNLGDVCWLPVFGIHRDPQYWPDSEKFDPERFSDENRSKILMSTFVPFGIGPRNCIGSRFAIMETKLLLFYLLSSFEIVPTEKTRIPLELLRDDLLTGPKGGFWFGFKRRNSQK